MSSPDLEPQVPLGAVLSNDELTEIFKCSPQMGMRRSLTTNTLVVTTSAAALYADRWIDGILHYTGMGQSGDQRLDRTQNRTLAESDANGVAVHLFEVLADNEYTYRGRVALAGEPYQERQLDREGQERLVWMFPLRLLAGAEAAALPAEVLERAQVQRARVARRLSDEEVAHRAQLAPAQSGKRTVSSSAYTRDPNVAETAKRRAQGFCQLCQQPAPFASRRGEPYLETHHIVWLARGGEDTVENTVALCPNCHRRMHELDAAEDVAVLRRAVSCQVIRSGGD